MRTAAVLASIFFLSTAATSYAQGGGPGNPQISYDALMSAPQGAWAEYVTTMKGKPEKLTMRYALVEKSAKKMALEIDGQTPMGALVMRMEFSPADQPNAWKISAAKMSMGGQPAQDMPVPANTPLVKKGDAMGEVIGKGPIKTPVGTFECKEYKKVMPQGTLNLWVSDKVLPVGLVKQELGDGQLSTILSQTGTGATSKMDALKKAAPSEGAKPAPSSKPAAPDTTKPKK